MRARVSFSAQNQVSEFSETFLFLCKIALPSTCGKVLLLQLSNKSKQIIGGKQGVMHEISCNLCTKSILVVKVSARSP